VSRELDPTRECGDCTECCVLHGMAGENARPCRHLVAGLGCGIHQTRPESCRTWFCEWRYGLGRDEHRPDKVGAVPHPGVVPGTIRMAIAPRERSTPMVDSLLGLLEWMAERHLLATWVTIHTESDEPGPSTLKLVGPPEEMS
jgi:hypothetical protein